MGKLGISHEVHSAERSGETLDLFRSKSNQARCCWERRLATQTDDHDVRDQTSV